MPRHALSRTVPATPALAALLLALFALTPGPAHAAWPNNPGNGNVVLGAAAGDQNYPRAIPDGAGGAIVVWSDSRTGTTDIYAQRVSAAGVPLWTANGVAICTAASWQESPQIASDGAGGAFVVWHDYRNGTDNNIYAQRINSSGTPQWAANGVVICSSAGAQQVSVITPDGSGGAIMAWEDLRSGAALDIYAQRVSATGAVQWAANGVAVCTAANVQFYAKLAADAAGGAILCWVDERAGNQDVYAQRISGAGVTQWTANGVAICTQPNAQAAWSIVPDGAGGAILAWDDFRNGADYDIYAQRVNAAGSVQWAANGVAVIASTGNQTNSLLVSDESGGVVVAWMDSRTGEYDIYAQRLGPAGAPVWTSTGTSLCSVSGNQICTSIVPDGSGGAIVSWYDFRTGNTSDVYAQRITALGTPFWASGGAALCTAVGNQLEVTSVSDGAGGAIVAWVDQRSTTRDIYAQRIETYGNLGNPEPAISQVRDVTGDQGGFVKVSWARSYLDASPTFSILDYRLWRSVPASALTAGAMLARGVTTDPDEAVHLDRFLVLPMAAQDYAWELVGTQAAGLLPSYSLVAATTRDSLGGSNPKTAFMVEARTGTSLASDRWYSAPDSGYSVDNLAPAAPAPFTGTYSGGASVLHWNPNAEADLAGYRLYRGSSVSFTPSEANLVAALADTGHVDAAGAPYWYKLTAVDEHGNESPVATLLPAGTTDIEAGASARAFFALGSANPVRTGGTTTLRFGLAAAGRASLALYDATGRRVRELVTGSLEAGEHAIAWDGRDEAGRAAAPGLYFARFETAGFTATRKLVVQD